MFSRPLLTTALSLLLFLPAIAQPASETPKPEPHLRFAFVGCNRIGFTELTPDNPSSANRQQLLQTCLDLAKTPPSHLFLIGDIVTNYAHGSETLESQLKGWVQLYKQSALAETTTVMVPVVGNHEVLTSTQDPVSKLWTDYPNPDTLPVWEDVLQDYLLWSDGPTMEGENADGLTQDQSRLSFTVRQDDVLFICVNTDTFIDDTTIGDVPLVWIEKKLLEAEQDDSIDHVFVLGHKPVERPDLPGEIIRDSEDKALDSLMARTPKLRAFLTAHFHLWDCRATDSGVLQVIAGNGGTAPSGNFNADGKGYFGYTVVELEDDGSLVIENWGRPIPTPYDSNEPQPPAVLLQRLPFPAKAP